MLEPMGLSRPRRAMSTCVEASVGGERQRLRLASTVARFALIGVVLAVAAGGFAYLGGWLTQRDLTPARFIDAFQRVNGVHAGFRRNHAKGVGVSGFFDSITSARFCSTR